MIEARMEQIEQKQKSSFMHYLVPQAIVKFKQGFGRLIRHKEDRGAIICLDTRVVNKRYGQAFLDSLPTCQTAFVDRSTLVQSIKEHLKH
jgi:ATP-dependent DNA helicase DinG